MIPHLQMKLADYRARCTDPTSIIAASNIWDAVFDTLAPDIREGREADEIELLYWILRDIEGRRSK